MTIPSARATSVGNLCVESDPPRKLFAFSEQELGRGLSRWYRWGWVPLVGGCLALATISIAAWEIVLPTLGFRSSDPALRRLYFTRAAVTSLLLGVWAGGYMLWMRERIERARDELHAMKAAMDERMWRIEQAAGVGALCRILAHEIRDPLNGMSLHCDILERTAHGLAPSEAERIVPIASELRRGAHRIAVLIDDYVTYCHSDRNTEHQLLDLGSFLEEIAAGYSINNAPPITVEGAKSLAAIRGDRERLEQLAERLLDNPTAATSTALRIQLDHRGGCIELALLYVGSMFAEPSAVFRAFYSTPSEGPMLDWAVVRDIVREHGGEVRAENVPEGARVVIGLRAAEAA